jgi:hypothetical protein
MKTGKLKADLQPLKTVRIFAARIARCGKVVAIFSEAVENGGMIIMPFSSRTRLFFGFYPHLAMRATNKFAVFDGFRDWK